MNGSSGKAPPEYIEHLYKKEYGLTTREFLAEPIDRVMFFVKIKEFEGKRDKIENDRMKRNK